MASEISENNQLANANGVMAENISSSNGVISMAKAGESGG